MQDNRDRHPHFRNAADEFALPIRRFGAFLPGEGVGGSGNHWGGLHWRFCRPTSRIRSVLAERYGASAIPDDMTIQDWASTYDELEPTTTTSTSCAASPAKPANLRGQIIEGGNVFEGPRSDEYPNKPLKSSAGGLLMAEAAKSLGYQPFPIPVSNSSAPYTNPEGVTLGGCQYCGFCNRTACEANAKASSVVTLMPVLRADPKFELRTRAFVSRLVYDKAARRVTGVVYTDLRNGEEYEQPAGIVVLSAYVFGNTQFLLLAGVGEPYDRATGKGVVGKNYAYQFEAGAVAFFEDRQLNSYMGAPGQLMCIDDFNGENFDHGGLGFFGGGYFAGGSGGSAPIYGRALRMARRAGARNGSRRQ